MVNVITQVRALSFRLSATDIVTLGWRMTWLGDNNVTEKTATPSWSRSSTSRICGLYICWRDSVLLSHLLAGATVFMGSRTVEQSRARQHDRQADAKLCPLQSLIWRLMKCFWLVWRETRGLNLFSILSKKLINRQFKFWFTSTINLETCQPELIINFFGPKVWTFFGVLHQIRTVVSW